MKAAYPEQVVMRIQDEVEVCPRCKQGLVFRAQPDLPYCYTCGGLNAGDRGIVYARKIAADPPPSPDHVPLVLDILP